MEQDIINNIFQLFQKNNPNPKTELNYTNNFTLTIAVILSAQATDISVNKATQDLFMNYDNPAAILKLGEEGLRSYIKTIGLYNSKAANIIKLSQILVEEFKSQIPENFDELIKLPGIGRKTANVILNAAFGEPKIAVDTHVQRVSNRIGLSLMKSPEGIEQELMAKIPEKWKKNAHNWMVLHGRYVCKARKPECSRCFLRELCAYDNKTR